MRWSLRRPYETSFGLFSKSSLAAIIDAQYWQQADVFCSSCLREAHHRQSKWSGSENLSLDLYLLEIGIPSLTDARPSWALLPHFFEPYFLRLFARSVKKTPSRFRPQKWHTPLSCTLLFHVPPVDEIARLHHFYPLQSWRFCFSSSLIVVVISLWYYVFAMPHTPCGALSGTTLTVFFFYVCSSHSGWIRCNRINSG